jgi:hypothetical protein
MMQSLARAGWGSFGRFVSLWIFDREFVYNDCTTSHQSVSEQTQ